MSPTQPSRDTTESDETEATEDAGEAAAIDQDPVDETDESDETDDVLSEQDELDLKRLDIALVTLDDESLRRGLVGLNEKQRQELATQLNLPRATVHLGDGLAPLVRRKLRGLSVDRQHAIVFGSYAARERLHRRAARRPQRRSEPRRPRRSAARRHRRVRARARPAHDRVVRDLRRSRSRRHPRAPRIRRALRAPRLGPRRRARRRRISPASGSSRDRP